MNMIYSTMLVVAITSVILMATTNDLFAKKGLKVYLTINSNQRSQDATIKTYQYDNVVDTRLDWIQQGTTELTLNYQKDQIENGEFQICVELWDGLQGCGNGYDEPEKKPEHVTVNIHRNLVPLNNENSQSQSQSSNNENENNNALSQSQETTIYICKENGCFPQ
jgi:hypothetical protein